MANNNKMVDAQKSAVVIMLACYWTPTEVVTYVSEEWDIDIRKQSVQRYDPTKHNGQRSLAKKWCDLFHATRHRFLTDAAMHAVSKMPYRMGIYQKVIDGALKMRNYDMVLRAMEQAAKDEGGSYTNRQKVDIDQTIQTGVMKVPYVDSKERALQIIAYQQANVPGAGGSPDQPN